MLNIYDGYMLINSEPNFNDASGFNKLVDNFINEIKNNLPIRPSTQTA